MKSGTVATDKTQHYINIESAKVKLLREATMLLRKLVKVMKRMITNWLDNYNIGSGKRQKRQKRRLLEDQKLRDTSGAAG